MGIPKFYKWLNRRYPMAVSKVEHEEDVPPVDNLYIDMNGLVHMVIHGNSVERHVMTSQMVNRGKMDELWAELFRYIDDIVHMVNPRKLLFMALDSVTPITKMTQQRARRMKDAHAIEEMTATARQYGEPELFDINAISPGTPFMREVNLKLDLFIQQKVAEDPMYQHLRIIFSDSNVPGEGEHKIMEFLRHYKISPDYDPNTRHCIYGMDADLIMLALVSHEPHTFIFREVAENRSPGMQSAKGVTRSTMLKVQDFEILYVSILREYFELEYKDLASQLSFPFDLERIIDDFIFFSLFVGNDFVPYLNTIDINNGSLDEIIRIYKRTLPKLKNYITYKGDIMWSGAELIFQELGKSELAKLKERRSEFVSLTKQGTVAADEFDEGAARARLMLEKKTAKIESLRAKGKLNEFVLALRKKKGVAPVDVSPTVGEVSKEAEPLEIAPEELPDSEVSDIEKEELTAGAEAAASSASAESNLAMLEKMCGMYERDEVNAKRLYYMEKFKFDIVEPEGKKKLDALISSYLEGLQWVLYYYYCGVKHWGWYFPYHYAPLVSDITSPQKYVQEGKEMTFAHLKEKNVPVTPFEQLLSILPRSSRNLLPVCYHRLYETDSEICDLYPSHYATDFNGRALPWEAIKLIPFVDECRVMAAETKAIAAGPAFTPEEAERNVIHSPVQYTYKFPDTEKASVCLKQEFKYANEKAPSFQPVLARGVELPCYDYPSLKHVDVASFRLIHVRHAGTYVDGAELAIKSDGKEDFAALLTQPVYVGYPFLREAWVESIVTRRGVVTLANDGYHTQMHSSRDAAEMYQACRDQMYEERLNCVGDIGFVCCCRVLEGLTKSYKDGGEMQKQFSLQRSYFPNVVVSLQRDPRYYQNVDPLLASQKAQFPIGSPCVLMAEPYFGGVGTISQNGSHGNLSVVLRQSADKANIDGFNRISAAAASAEKNQYRDFVSLKALNRALGVSGYVMSRITSTIMVYVRDPKKKQRKFDMPKYNLGLGLKSQSQGINIPYHVCYSDFRHEWLVSKEVADYIDEYIRRFPTVVSILDETCARDRDETLFADMLFPSLADPEEGLRSILDWILALPVSKLPYVPCGSKIMPLKLRETIREELKKLPAAESAPMLVGNNKIRNVFVETHPFWIRPFGLKSYYEYQIGDRVINIKTSGLGTAPFGSMGTIVGIYQEKILVQFDTPLLTGSTYWGQCEKCSGKIVEASAVMNLSMYPRLVVH